MKRLSLFLAVIVTVASIFTNAEELKNLVVNGNATDGLKNWEGIQEVVDGGPGGVKCFSVTNGKNVFSQELIPVDPKSEYKLTGWFKSGDGRENQIYVGLRLLDKNKRFIDSTSVAVQPQSETALTAGAEKGGTVIKIRDASKWEQSFKDKRLTVAFDADDSGEYKDLPNYNYYEVKKLEKKDAFWEATLSKPLSEDFAVETKVRAHWACGHFMYLFSAKKNFAAWTKYSNNVKPAVKPGAEEATFWPGTEYVQVLILANHGQKDGETLLFGNISLEKAESQK